LGGQLRRVQITKVQKSTYFAELLIMRGDQLVQIDARPSDSIAVALRLSAPIYAQETLLTAVEGEDAEESEEPDFEPVKSAEELSAEQLKQYLENLRPEDFGKFNL
jgi:bifunctional DNase/RNase